MGIVSKSSRARGFFSNFTEKELLFLTKFITKASFEAGDLIISQGCFSEYLYIIETGQVAVYITLPGDSIKQKSILVESQIFSEVAFLTDDLTTATIVAKTSVNCLLLKRAVLNALRILYPEIAFKIEYAIAKQTNQKIICDGSQLINTLLTLQTNHNLYSDHAHSLPSNKATYQELNIKAINRQLLDKLAFLNALTKAQIDKLLTFMQVKLYDRGYQLNEQILGKIGLVFSGAVMFFLAKEKNLIKSIGIISIGDLFLQQFFTQNLKSVFEFVTCEESIILELDINQYQQLKHTEPEIFYKLSQYVHTAFVHWLSIINRQCIRINCEYLNFTS
ncbi:cyclic nucleotide-binding domain-containing protein [Legionella sp. D16C41]|uniref:cyclic nucleotide-binding domain-containing protein n=1 Tax=Legionella sp. D16C41 TaxID=3402688 RepID=UPI003AF4EBE3